MSTIAVRHNAVTLQHQTTDTFRRTTLQGKATEYLTMVANKIARQWEEDNDNDNE